jgi:hypothetical protein
LDLTGTQIRAARGALFWTLNGLSERSGVATATLKRYEAVDGVPKSRKGNLAALRSVFESVGIEFIGAPDDAPGIRIHGGSSKT